MQRLRLFWDRRQHGLGIELLDREHQTLFDLVNSLAQAVEHNMSHAETLEHVERVICFLAEHFAHEEEIMRLHDFPEWQKHAAEHEVLIQEAITLMSALSPEDRVRKMLATAFLTDCAETHIVREDRSLAEFLKKKGIS